MQALPILKELISIPSVNPMGRDLSGPEYFETRLTEWLAGFFEQIGVLYEQFEVAPGRANILARFDSPGSATTIMMDAHQDTVPTDGMIIDPFDPVVKDGKIYGRGSCDVKGGMAAMLAAFARLVDDSPAGAANVVLSCSVDEEATVMGVLDLAKLWTDPERRTEILPSAPDMSLVAEPTDLNIVVAHRGATRWKIKTSGRACHSSTPTDGISAIYRMGKVLTCLEEYSVHLPTTIPAHPLCGQATISVGRIEGGISVNTVPDSCTIEIDRRVIPGEDGVEVIDQVAKYLRERLDFEVDMLPRWITGASLPDDNNHGWADRLMEHIEAVAGSREKIGVPYGTNASRIAVTGVPSIVCGPGSVDQAHTKDEWLPIDELEQAAEIYYRFCSNGHDRQ